MKMDSDDSKNIPQNSESLTLFDTVKIGKDVYVIERHFSGERDVTAAVYAAIKNDAFRTPK